MKILLLSVVFLLGCNIRQQDHDVSAEPRSQAVLGSRYEVVGDLEAYGIRENSQAPVHAVVLIPPPGFDGPEVGFRIPVRPGSTVTVHRVLRTNRLFDPDMALIAELDGTPLSVEVPVRIDLFLGNEAQGYCN